MAELGCLSISTTVFVSRRRGRAQREEESRWDLQGLAGCTASSLDARDREWEWSTRTGDFVGQVTSV